MVLGDNGEEKLCWVTPFTIEGEKTHFFQTVTTDPETFDPWHHLLPEEEEVNPQMESLIDDLHSHLLLKESLSEDGKEVKEFSKKRGEKNQFPKVPSEEVFRLCILFLASRTKMGDL